MKAHRGWQPTLVLVGSLATSPALAFGQGTSTQWPGLNPAELQTVYVRDDAGVETLGKLLTLTPEALVLLVDGEERRFAPSTVARIEKRDSLRNGAIVGGVMGLVVSGLSGCPAPHPGARCAGVRAAALGFSVALNTGVGVGIDALIPGRSTLYVAPPRSAAFGEAFRRPGRAGIRVAIRW